MSQKTETKVEKKSVPVLVSSLGGGYFLELIQNLFLLKFLNNHNFLAILLGALVGVVIKHI